jgi:hypothetical protein
LEGLAMQRTANVAALFLLLPLLSIPLARAGDGTGGARAGLRYGRSAICRQSNPPALLNLLFGGPAAGEFRKEQKRVLVRRSDRQPTRSRRCHSSRSVEPHVPARAHGPIPEFILQGKGRDLLPNREVTSATAISAPLVPWTSMTMHELSGSRDPATNTHRSDRA